MCSIKVIIQNSCVKSCYVNRLSSANSSFILQIYIIFLSKTQNTLKCSQTFIKLFLNVAKSSLCQGIKHI